MGNHKRCCRYTNGKADVESGRYCEAPSILQISKGGWRERRGYRHMSHQTGATFSTELFQTTELMKKFKQPRPAQAMNNTVPTFDAGSKSWEKVNGTNESREKRNDEITFQMPIKRNGA
jgi:hypothetical protein